VPEAGTRQSNFLKKIIFFAECLELALGKIGFFLKKFRAREVGTRQSNFKK
jgi:hypothetical protein